MSDWSIQRVEQLATDAAAFKAAQGTAKPSKWQNLGRDDRLVWGECQGSGSTPYQVRVDLIDVTYKCSCPSRKLPCKHTLGLLLMVAGGTNIATASPPEFVAEWSANRAKRAEAKQARESKEATAAPLDPVARAKRTEKREARVASGIDQLETWLTDIVGQGLAVTRSQGPAFWSHMASRLVDAQAPGLARRVKELGDIAMASDQWQDELLAGLARLQLLIDGYRGIDRLPPELAAEVRSIVGWTQEQDALRSRAGTRDRWQVIARRQTEDDALKTQFSWLEGSLSGLPRAELKWPRFISSAFVITGRAPHGAWCMLSNRTWCSSKVRRMRTISSR
ncbi:MAG TPA: SWIM zinc finger family protein [Steroidobacter sp.]|uniref:SWIM zinc finger family protein n=1 Tax=Steroidobacter sp. TaxID=1978227 RepID=UPI002ED8E97E